MITMLLNEVLSRFFSFFVRSKVLVIISEEALRVVKLQLHHRMKNAHTFMIVRREKRPAFLVDLS